MAGRKATEANAKESHHLVVDDVSCWSDDGESQPARMNDPDAQGPRVIYTLKSRGALMALRVLGLINLVIGTPLTLAAVAMGVLAFVKLFTGDPTSSFEREFGIVLGLSGPVCLWSGYAMIFSRIKVSPDWLSAGGGLMLHRWHRAEILAIDIRRHDFGRAPRTVPFVVFRNGESSPLLALTSTTPDSAGLPPASSGESQQAAVDELRAALGVGGKDLPSDRQTENATLT